MDLNKIYHKFEYVHNKTNYIKQALYTLKLRRLQKTDNVYDNIYWSKFVFVPDSLWKFRYFY